MPSTQTCKAIIGKRRRNRMFGPFLPPNIEAVSLSFMQHCAIIDMLWQNCTRGKFVWSSGLMVRDCVLGNKIKAWDTKLILPTTPLWPYDHLVDNNAKRCAGNWDFLLTQASLSLILIYRQTAQELHGVTEKCYVYVKYVKCLRQSPGRDCPAKHSSQRARYIVY